MEDMSSARMEDVRKFLLKNEGGTVICYREHNSGIAILELNTPIETNIMTGNRNDVFVFVTCHTFFRQDDGGTSGGHRQFIKMETRQSDHNQRFRRQFLQGHRSHPCNIKSGCPHCSRYELLDDRYPFTFEKVTIPHSLFIDWHH